MPCYMTDSRTILKWFDKKNNIDFFQLVATYLDCQRISSFNSFDSFRAQNVMCHQFHTEDLCKTNGWREKQNANILELEAKAKKQVIKTLWFVRYLRLHEQQILLVFMILYKQRFYSGFRVSNSRWSCLRLLLIISQHGKKEITQPSSHHKVHSDQNSASQDWTPELKQF